MGEMALGVCSPDAGSEGRIITESSFSDESGRLAPSSPFFCLNFSSQLGLLTLLTQSELPTVVANICALSRMLSLLRGSPWR